MLVQRHADIVILQDECSIGPCFRRHRRAGRRQDVPHIGEGLRGQDAQQQAEGQKQG